MGNNTNRQGPGCISGARPPEGEIVQTNVESCAEAIRRVLLEYDWKHNTQHAINFATLQKENEALRWSGAQTDRVAALASEVGRLQQQLKEKEEEGEKKASPTARDIPSIASLQAENAKLKEDLKNWQKTWDAHCFVVEHDLQPKMKRLEDNLIEAEKAFNAILKCPVMPFPDPAAHSWKAFGERVFAAWSEMRSIASAYLAKRTEP